MLTGKEATEILARYGLDGEMGHLWGNLLFERLCMELKKARGLLRNRERELGHAMTALEGVMEEITLNERPADPSVRVGGSLERGRK